MKTDPLDAAIVALRRDHLKTVYREGKNPRKLVIKMPDGTIIRVSIKTITVTRRT